MLYCAACQVLSQDGETCPSCGRKKLREVRPNDPVLLLTSGDPESEEISAAFDDAGIPHEKRLVGTGSPPSMLYGRIPGSEYKIFVPYGKLEHSKEILQSIGVLDEFGHRENRLPEAEEAQPEEEERPMSPARRAIVRAFSAVLFFLLIWVVVSASDSIANWFRNLFHWF